MKVSVMLCQVCQQKEAKVHLTSFEVLGIEAGTERNQNFCEQCADAYFASIPGMNSSRNLICLSDSYRSKLYDLLETVHPEAFDISDTQACERGCKLIQVFLRAHLKNDNIEMNNDAFDMLCIDFFCSHHFYTRVDERKQKGL
jgi:protein-arginine kinase activator protein McsA